MEKRPRGKTILALLLVLALSFAVTASQVLYSFDKLITDPVYQIPSAPNSSIRILAIDERTIAALGEYADWTRDIPAQLVELLSRDPETAPAVIAFDVMFASPREEAADARFAEACRRAGNVVTAVNLVFRTELSTDGSVVTADTDHISAVEYPYGELRASVSYGFANTWLDRDQFVRFARLRAEYEGETIWSFPCAVYQKYAERAGFEARLPETDASGFYNFTYTGGSGAYEVLSLSEVLEGNIDPAVFTGGVVFVGAYAPGMQDSYNGAIQHGSQMYGVEIQANILEALLEGKTGLAVNPLLFAAAVALLAAVYFLAIRRMRIVPAALLGLGIIAAAVLAGRLLCMRGHVIRIAEPILAVLLIYACQLVVGYIRETLKKRRILNAFKKYVAPQVVEEVANRGDFSIVLGG